MTLAEAVAALRIHDPKTRCLAQLISERHAKPIKRLLVVGCGSGLEAAALSQELGCSAVGTEAGRTLSARTLRSTQEAQSSSAKALGTTLSLYDANITTILRGERKEGPIGG